MHIPRLVCAWCNIEMTVKQVGYVVEMIASFGPYYKVSTDWYHCVQCGYDVLMLAQAPQAAHFDPVYDTVRAARQARFAGENPRERG